MPLISICIPAYKRADFLKRLLDSIVIQQYRDFEVIVTDDSPDNQVKLLCDSYQRSFNLHYFKNPTALGTPENWNEAVRKASAPWIKIMHDDDWFADPHSLRQFANATTSDASFIYSAFNNVKGSEKTLITPEKWRVRLLQKNPISILSRNIIGPPSTTLYRKNDISFDNKMKWLVDMDFYIRYLATAKAIFINQPLINIGIHDTQVTVSSQLNPEVEIPEHLRLIEKLGSKAFDNLPFYDAIWRFIRNLDISNPAQLETYSPQVPPQIIKMIDTQNRVGRSALRIGPLSKFFMFFSWLNR
jgi:glycosyltransferase involved in cell wall biosynthesis